MAIDASPVAALQAWVTAHPRYVYTVDAAEQTAAGADSTVTLRITVDSGKDTEDVHVLKGPGAGSDIHWSGGDTVEVHGPGFVHAIGLRMAVRDGRLLSPRRNDVRTGVFARVAKCYVTNAARVHAGVASAHATELVLADDRGVACGDEYQDGPITSDRIMLDPLDGHPLQRERLSGSTVVERWTIRDLHVPT